MISFKYPKAPLSTPETNRLQRLSMILSGDSNDYINHENSSEDDCALDSSQEEDIVVSTLETLKHSPSDEDVTQDPTITKRPKV